jgi:hypothetical protein
MTQVALAGTKRFSALRPTPVYDSYWRLAAERQAIFFRRLEGSPPPWTCDPILRHYKFTNSYRASNRTIQYLIRHVIYGDRYSSAPEEVIFRILLFKVFNRVDTWRRLESALGSLSWSQFSFVRYDQVLTRAQELGYPIYSAAYIIPPVHKSDKVKHRGHLHLVAQMMQDELTKRIEQSSSLSDVFWLLKGYPSLGDFIAYQLAIDLNYSTVLDHAESEFVVAGPGARDGLAKCFANASEFAPEDLIELVTERQVQEFDRLGIKFRSLWGRPLQLIDCQNLFCEIGKYARVAHPEWPGIFGRIRIKQRFRPNPERFIPWYPPKWRLSDERSRGEMDPSHLQRSDAGSGI